MRHRKARTKLGRAPDHAKAMRSNMLASLVQHRRIETTERKARELRSVAEKAVTKFTSLGDILLKDPDKLPDEDRARIVHAMRLVRRVLRDRDAVLTMYEDIAPRYLGRPGGYTRMVKTRFRKGDGAPMAILEFVEAEMPEREGAPRASRDAEKKKGLLDRLRRRKKKS